MMNGHRLGIAVLGLGIAAQFGCVGPPAPKFSLDAHEEGLKRASNWSGQAQHGKCIEADGSYYNCKVPSTFGTKPPPLAGKKPLVSGPESSFSIAAWSCNEVYASRPDREHPVVPLRYAMSLWTLAHRAEGSLRIDGIPSKPSLGVALGDQVYVDPHPTKAGSGGYGLSPFGGPRSNEWRAPALKENAAGSHQRFFENLYKAYLRSEPMGRVLATLPTVMMWDDHEIRDGWGSQRDEQSPIWQSWYASARGSYLRWQAIRNPYPAGRRLQIKSSQRISTDFSVRVTPHMSLFALDTRSNARPNPDPKSALLGTKQLERLRKWLSRSPCSAASPKLFVLTSPTPLFVKSRGIARGLIRTLGKLGVKKFSKFEELEDDFLDQWGDESHADEQKTLIRALSSRFQKCTSDRLLVLSGDIHESGMYQLRDSQGEVRGWEITTSGIAADIEPKRTNQTWLGLYPRRADPEALGAWPMGRIGYTPAFAEIVIRKDDPTRGLRVVWYTFAEKNRIANTHLACGGFKPGGPIITRARVGGAEALDNHILAVPLPMHTAACEIDGAFLARDTRGSLSSISTGKVFLPSLSGRALKSALSCDAP